MINKVPEYENVIIKTIPATGEIVYLKGCCPGLSWGNLPFQAMHLWMANDVPLLMVFQSPGSNALQTADNVYNELEPS